MAMLNCYQRWEGCREDEYERYPSTDYELNWNMNFMIQPPGICRTIEIYRWLKEHCGFNLLMVPKETLQLWPAHHAGWRPEELVVWWSKGLTTKGMDGFEQNRREVFGINSRDFFAWYLDEPQVDKMTVNDVSPLYDHWRNYYYGQHFIVGDYGNNWKKFYNTAADIVTYTGTGARVGFSSDQRGAWTEVYKLVGPGGFYWIIYPSDKGEEHDLIEKAKNLQAGTLALYAGGYDDCNKFMREVDRFCQMAREQGLLKMKSSAEYLARTYWCRYSDCRECEGHPVSDPKYWQDKPLSGLCPKPKIILPPEFNRTEKPSVDQSTTTLDTFIYSRRFF